MHPNLFADCHLRSKLEANEMRALEGAVSDIVTIDPRTDLVGWGQSVSFVHYLVRGTTMTYFETREGDRQIFGIGLPGDFLDFDNWQLGRPSYSIRSLDGVTVARIPYLALDDLVFRQPGLMKTLCFSLCRDVLHLQRWIFRMGRQSAERRIAHLMCDLLYRLRQSRNGAQYDVDVPLRQRDYADACGITSVHANRCFQALRERGFVDVTGNRKIRILDEEGLRTFAQYHEPETSRSVSSLRLATSTRACSIT